MTRPGPEQPPGAPAGAGAAVPAADPWITPELVPATADPWVTRSDLVFGGIVVAALAVAGVLAGAIWSAISPHAVGIVVSSTLVIPDESEGFVAADGRFLIITAVIGLAAGLASWAMRSRRGPVAAAALGLGGSLGATLTALVGHLLSSGHDTGARLATIRLPVTLHAHSLIAVEGAVALLAYLVGALFVAPDDLGRTATPPRQGSVHAAGDVQGSGRDGNGPGFAQDGQFATQ